MDEMYFVLVEWVLQGCDVKFYVKGVTADQQYAYDWLNENVPIEIQRQVKNAPLMPLP